MATLANRTNMSLSKCALLVVAFLSVQVASGWAQTPARPDSPKPPVDYQIGAGDVLQIFVWKEADLTKEVTVRLDGRVTVPLLGDVDAAGRSPQQLSEELARSFGKFVEAPRVTVGVNRANSTRFYVVGLVGKPGEFQLSGSTTVLQGLALAGGFREYAKTESILIIRQEPGGQRAIPVNYKRIEDGKDIGQNVLLRPGDTIVVP
jgi:polysaccharide biosynthesis/export protein